jgi:hypothetical protein
MLRNLENRTSESKFLTKLLHIRKLVKVFIPRADLLSTVMVMVKLVALFIVIKQLMVRQRKNYSPPLLMLLPQNVSVIRPS